MGHALNRWQKISVCCKQRLFLLIGLAESISFNKLQPVWMRLHLLTYLFAGRLCVQIFARGRNGDRRPVGRSQLLRAVPEGPHRHPQGRRARRLLPEIQPDPWSAVNCDGGNEHLYKYNPYSVTMVMSGEREVVFDTGRRDWNPCRRYSLNATIINEHGILKLHCQQASQLVRTPMSYSC